MRGGFRCFGRLVFFVALDFFLQFLQIKLLTGRPASLVRGGEKTMVLQKTNLQPVPGFFGGKDAKTLSTLRIRCCRSHKSHPGPNSPDRHHKVFLPKPFGDSAESWWPMIMLHTISISCEEKSKEGKVSRTIRQLKRSWS